MSSCTTPGPVVVGVDESGSSAALRWAVDEARRRSTRLGIVHALEGNSEAFIRANPVFAAAERRAAEQVLDTAAATARAMAPGLDVRPVLGAGPPGVALLARAPGAELLVLGSGAGAASPACCWARRRCTSRCTPPASSWWSVPSTA
jgi:nucleotide-binding universal stress UspA family protein